MREMLSAILGIIAGATSIVTHWFMTKMRPGPQPALHLLHDSPGSSYKDDVVVEWKKYSLGEILLTPMKNDYTAVIVHAVMEGNFYNVRLVSDPSKHMHVHASLLFTKEELDASNRTKN